ncbi:hypothetical protein QWY75_10885 [Pontixanthobacter aestiaquae]|uniref:Uncharacterized protein n=1 Tax=Pontixanthobacter aestiaquae TaxID=1509367 RepID=A0A844Z0R0_9SPHN|nr:DUF2207 domain-containing protein [Pontixanthobacter aestiaquae]MDN3646705.1 hypothetical protein [Pontixanthobacter aestiaquae]MXO82311.1 hypothetical protein [Pontixanthobacter aestiaquae]
MLHRFFEEGYWFAPKKFGYGSGLPIAWQGWVLLAGYIVLMFGAALLLESGGLGVTAILVAAMIIMTILFVFIAKRRTKGGWKWRP